MPNLIDDPSYFRETAIQDMMGRPPGWLLHSGLSGIAVVVLIVFGLAALISYPEKVEATFLLQSETIPIALHAKSASVIDTVFAQNEERVSVGDTLLIFRSETDWKAVRNLDLKLTVLERRLVKSQQFSFNSSSHLLQGLYEGGDREIAFPASVQIPLVAIKTLQLARNSYLRNNSTPTEIQALRREINDADRLSASLHRQVELYEQELILQKKQVERMALLKEEGIVSDQEAEEKFAIEISARRQKEVLVSSDIQNQLRVQQLRQSILGKKLEHREQLADFDRQVLTQLKLLRTSLNEYRDAFVLVAKEPGVINWSPTTRGEITVNPVSAIGYLLQEEGSDRPVARLQLPTIGEGRVKQGDRVVLNFDAFPFREYGQVEGVLGSIAPMALPDENNEYYRLATVQLPNALSTSYGKTIKFQHNLTGTARVITKERTILQRLVDKVVNLSKNT